MRWIIHNFDNRAAGLINEWPRFFYLPMVIFSFLGQPIITIGVLVLIAGFAWGKNNIRLLAASGVAFSAILINTLLKLLLERNRPATEYVKNMWFDTFSFPSGHSCGAMVAYGLLAYIAWHLLPQPWGWVAIVIASLLIILIGISRVYLGAHYASDVIGGWLLGGIALLIIIYVIKPL